MKKTAIALISGLLCLCLCGCGTVLLPEKAADGLDWNRSWVTVGGIVGVDTPDGMEARENNEALAAQGMSYATWSIGEAVPYTNADGEEAQLYDAQIFLLLSGSKSVEQAEDTLAQWQEMARQQYAIDGTVAETHNGQAFTVITYTFGSETNPYARGASAYGVYRNYAVSVELVCQHYFDGDAAQLLARFLDSCHYAMP